MLMPKNSFQYYAPAIDCREMTRQEIFDGNRFGQPFSNMTHPLHHSNIWYGRNSSDTPSTNTLSLAYQTNFSTSAQPHNMYGFPLARDYSNVKGTACRFYYGTYDVDYEWKNNDYTLGLHVSRGKIVGSPRWMDINRANGVDINPEKWPHGVDQEWQRVNFVLNHVLSKISIFQTVLPHDLTMLLQSFHSSRTCYQALSSKSSLRLTSLSRL